jgi:lipopolysaccharide/colanic/teichoic acid biosynthesis glycosyltransferase
MELQYSSKSKSAERVYKRFVIDAVAALPVGMPARGKPVFFYIGKNPAKIELLTGKCERGYAAESTENAIGIMKRLGNKSSFSDLQGNIDVILVEALTAGNSLEKLYHFLSASGFSSVPLILDVSGLPAEKVQQFRGYRFLDEIIALEENADMLLSKIALLKKIKSIPDQQAFSTKIEVSAGMAGSFRRNAGKRIFDIVFSAIAILLLSPVFLLIAVLISLESRGTVFYISERAGLGYKIFRLYQFRTMAAGADKEVQPLFHAGRYGSAGKNGLLLFNESNNPGITRIGSFLRNTSLDELPRLFNVFVGDMSLVGKRPLPLCEAVALTTDEHAARFMEPVGFTGMWRAGKREGK